MINSKASLQDVMTLATVSSLIPFGGPYTKASSSKRRPQVQRMMPTNPKEIEEWNAAVDAKKRAKAKK